MTRKKTIILAIVILIVGVGFGVGGSVIIQKFILPTGDASATKVTKVDGPILSIGEDLQFILQGGSMLIASISIEGKDAKSEEYLKGRNTFLKDRINIVISSKSLVDIQTTAAREKLRQELLINLNEVADNKIVSVLFPKFVYQ